MVFDPIDYVPLLGATVYITTVRRAGNEYRVEDGEGLTHVFAGTGALRRLARVEDAPGNRIVLQHDAAGRLAGIEDAGGRDVGSPSLISSTRARRRR